MHACRHAYAYLHTFMHAYIHAYIHTYIPVGTQRCDNVVAMSQISGDVIQPKPDLYTNLIDVDNYIGTVPTAILR